MELAGAGAAGALPAAAGLAEALRGLGTKVM
jgi:hypothetical protein